MEERVSFFLILSAVFFAVSVSHVISVYFLISVFYHLKNFFFQQIPPLPPPQNLISYSHTPNFSLWMLHNLKNALVCLATNLIAFAP